MTEWLRLESVPEDVAWEAEAGRTRCRFVWFVMAILEASGKEGRWMPGPEGMVFGESGLGVSDAYVRVLSEWKDGSGSRVDALDVL